MDTIRPYFPWLAVLTLLLLITASTSGQSLPFSTYTPLPPAASDGAPSSNLSKAIIDPSYATLYGGNNYDELLAEAHGRNSLCFAGVTSSTNLTLFSAFQTQNAGGFDGWVACADVNTMLPRFVSYFGGPGSDTITDIALLGDTLYAVGVTTSMTLPGTDSTYQTTSGGGQDCFVVSMSALDGSGRKTTFFGRQGDEYCAGIRADRNAVWIGGTTNELIDFVNPIQSTLRGPSDGIVAQLRRNLAGLDFSTLIGGDDADGIERIGLSGSYGHDKHHGSSTPITRARLLAIGWSQGPGLPVTENAFQKTYAGGIDAFNLRIGYDYDAKAASLEYLSYAGKAGDEVPRDMDLSRGRLSYTGWTTSSGWGTLGRNRIAGSSDGFVLQQAFTDTTVGDPQISYVGPSSTYNLPLAIGGLGNGITAVAGYSLVPGHGTAFMAGYDRDFNPIGTQFVGTAAPADFNTVKGTPFYWAGGGKTAQPIPTTLLAIQSNYGGGDFDMFGAQYKTSWSYHTILNLTYDDLSVKRNGASLGTILARSSGRVDPLAWDATYDYELERIGQTYNFQRILSDAQPLLNYSYAFNDKILSVNVPTVDDKEVGILAYNELDRPIDVVRFDQTVEHNELRRTAVGAGQFFYVPLPRNENFRITDGNDFIDYRPPKRHYGSDFPYLAGVLQATTANKHGAQSFELVLFEADGDPVALPITTAVEDGETHLAGLALEPAYPNPFRGSTTIGFATPAPTTVRLTVFDILGRRVQTLINGMQTAGAHSVEWDGRRSDGTTASSGTYLLRLEVDGYSVAKPVVLSR